MRPRPGLTVYNSSKGAVILMSKSMAGEFGPDKIRVNCVNPVFSPDTALSAEFAGGTVSEEAKKRVPRDHSAGPVLDAARRRERVPLSGVRRGRAGQRRMYRGGRRALRLVGAFKAAQKGGDLRLARACLDCCWGSGFGLGCAGCGALPARRAWRRSDRTAVLRRRGGRVLLPAAALPAAARGRALVPLPAARAPWLVAHQRRDAGAARARSSAPARARCAS